MQDSAKGIISGFIFQFEKALLMLSDLNKLNDVVSIEDVDDVAVLNDKTVLIAVQAKHTISSTGSTFQDTSYALWRTLQIWIQKIDKGIFDHKTKFVCCSNKEVKSDSLLYKFIKEDFDDLIVLLNQLKFDQEEKLKEIKAEDKTKGTSIEKILKIIKSVLRKRKQLQTIVSNLEVQIENNIKQDFLNKLHIGIDSYSEPQKDKIYQEFYGWIFERSQAKWCNNSNAIFSKKEFDEKHFQVFHNSAITNLIFRTKNDLGSIYAVEDELFEGMQTELFVKQIEDINRNLSAKSRIIKNAIINFFYYDIELSHIIKQGNFTKHDIDEFIKQCQDLWQDLYDNIVLHSPDHYTEEEMNNLAIKVFDETMSDLRIKFKDYVSFNQSNEYFKKGCLLKLSNIPKIGWHPEWDDKYKK